ncbi:PREDICTED: hexose carrier protein HEX6-like [Nelumbo nucifera]|uniref:Hexose carrier protein HEX6-like n=1 Tax=Nelumbo nucifera TaxID=4432 RepID=A0A1U8Q6Y1_NELNU|nr:PREDICTED: hexose carrier protein HEX6-like [Nelumbo nucifera]
MVYNCSLMSVPLYLSKIAPPQYRGAFKFNNGFQFSVGIGPLSANLINFSTERIRGGWGWRLSLALAKVPASILIKLVTSLMSAVMNGVVGTGSTFISLLIVDRLGQRVLFAIGEV